MQIYKTLYHLHKEYEITIVMISHDVDKALDYCNKVIEMKQGKIVFHDISSKYTTKGDKS